MAKFKGKKPFKKGKASTQNFKSKATKKKKFHKKNKIKFDVNARLVVKNLSFKITEDELKKFFEPYGEVLQVCLPKKNDSSLQGCGFVQYKYINEAKLALKSRNGQSLLGRAINIDWAQTKKEYLKTLSEQDNTNVEESKESEEEHENNLNDGAKNFKEKNKIYPKKSKQDNEESEANKLNANIKRKARLIIRNISFKATEESLKKHFEKYGEVIESILLKKENGDLVGCGFIQFKAGQSAAKAIIETNAKPYLGRAIFVDWAVPKCKYMSYMTEKQDEEEYLKNEVKVEPESDNDDVEMQNNESDIDKDVKVKSESSEEEESHSESDDSDNDANNVDDDDDDENKEDVLRTDNDKRVSANDAEDGNTIFFKNIPFSVTNEEFEEFAKQFGDIHYALICVDKLTEHSKGTGFVRFKTKEDANICFSAGNDRLTFHGQILEPKLALLRENLKSNDKKMKQPKDSRNLYLVKEGVILANSKAAVGVSTSDMSKRLALEQRKSEMLKNLNRFVSPYRLTIHNVPVHYNDDDIKKICLEMANVTSFKIKECRIMRHLKGPIDNNGKYTSKGYAFVTFSRHEDALTCLRKMNNNPSTFDKNNRPIVSFSIEDKAVINARKKRMEKSKLSNPNHQSYTPSDKNVSFKDEGIRSNMKNGKHFKQDKNKKNKLEMKNKVKSVSENQHTENYLGEMSKPGKLTKSRNRYKLKMQISMHKENVKNEKKKQKLSKKSQVIMKKREKRPKQTSDSGRKKNKKIAEKKNEKQFSDLVNKYKSKLVEGSLTQRVKSKWYEQNR